MILPTRVDYPVVAVGDLHGRLNWLDALLVRLRRRPEWPRASLVFLGDFPDRSRQVGALLDRVLELLADKPGSTAVMGNHDMALVSAAGLDGRPPSPYWVRRYGREYDHGPTFESYLGREPDYATPDAWAEELASLKAAMPPAHRDFLAGLPWGVEAAGHLFLHCGLSPELACPPATQWLLLQNKRWDRAEVQPRLGSRTDREFTPDYPVWVGADRHCCERPLAHPGKVQVNGHDRVAAPSANRVRVRIDTSGGSMPPLTACVLSAPGAEPVFVPSHGAD